MSHHTLKITFLNEADHLRFPTLICCVDANGISSPQAHGYQYSRLTNPRTRRKLIVNVQVQRTKIVSLRVQRTSIVNL
jgi:hypothetical protein